jgi:acyl carrier protein
MESKFLGAMAEVMEIEVDQINANTKFRDEVDFDSLCILSTIAVIDEMYGKSLTAEDLDDAETLSDLFGLTK